MNRIKEFFKSITIFEYCLWGASVLAIGLSFGLCQNSDYLNLALSLVGVTSLVFLAKGNLIGHILGLLFAAGYGAISYFCQYYGEMITFLGMNAPISIVSIIVWLKHPVSGKRTQVKINRLHAKDYGLGIALSLAGTVAFYFILRALDTANLIWSTISILTSLLAAYLALRRCPYYAIAYALNDIVLIVLWSLAAAENSEYVAMVVCFAAFLVNDLYGLFNWLKMQKSQETDEAKAE